MSIDSLKNYYKIAIKIFDISNSVMEIFMPKPKFRLFFSYFYEIVNAFENTILRC